MFPKLQWAFDHITVRARDKDREDEVIIARLLGGFNGRWASGGRRGGHRRGPPLSTQKELGRYGQLNKRKLIFPLEIYLQHLISRNNRTTTFLV